MQIVIHTIDGTFLVPTDKQAALIHWLQANAIKAGGQQVREQTNDLASNYSGKQLLNESVGGNS